MGNKFAGSDIVEIGIQIEKNGRDFYNTLAGRSGNGKAREIFKDLADEEEKHITTFRNILGSVHKYKPAASYPEEYFAYMNALAGGYVFTQEDKGGEIARNTKSDEEAVELGIGFEKDSILFYESMKKIVPEYDLAIVDGLIAQEQEHLRRLSDLKNSLSG